MADDPPVSCPDSLDGLRAVLADLPGPDEDAAAAADAREPQLTKPPGSLGRLETLARWLAMWQGRHPPRVETAAVHVFAGNHGVTARGVSAYPPSVTAQMVANFEAGGAAINQLCGVAGARLRVEAVELATPTADFTEAPAMSENECLAAFRTGWATVTGDIDVLCVGEMGIGNTTSAAAVAHLIWGGDAQDWTGPGTGVDSAGLSRKARAVADARALHSQEVRDGLDVLRRVGGRELAAIAGAVIAARLHRIPVLLDGYVTTAAAAVLQATAKDALDHCDAAHASREPGHRPLLKKLRMTPLLDLGMHLGEGSGAAVALNVVRAAAACHGGMTTFEEAGVSGKDSDG